MVTQKEPHQRRIFVAIDDTDNEESRGTGFRARQLATRLEDAGIARARGVTRHQLYVHPDIPYTSHNSALCLDLEWLGDSLDELATFCRNYLAIESAPGSDAAYCIAPARRIGADVVAFGRAAKSEILTRAKAESLALSADLVLEGVTGDHGGMIGALAAVGLRKSGHDGRFVWSPGVRELSGETTAAYLLEMTGIDVIRDGSYHAIAGSERILVEPWPRPVLLDDRVVLLVEKTEETDVECDWKILPREIIRQY